MTEIKEIIGPVQLAGSNCGSRNQLAIALNPNLAWMCGSPPPQLFTRWFQLEAPLRPQSQPFWHPCSHDYKPGNQDQVWALLFRDHPCLKKEDACSSGCSPSPHHWLPTLVCNQLACLWSFPLQQGSFNFLIPLMFWGSFHCHRVQRSPSSGPSL